MIIKGIVYNIICWQPFVEVFSYE